MPPVYLLIKPASGSCNLRCRYCFYTDEMNYQTCAQRGFMTPETLEAVVRRTLEFAQGSATFAFQGGEPTLVGLEFYRLLVRLVAQYNTRGLAISYALQTNGLLLDETWAAFLAQHRFLVGLSLDGPQELHDANRLDAQGKGTHARVLQTVRLLRQYEVEFNILTVVTSAVARSGRKVLNFLDKNGFAYRQFIPCLPPLDGENTPWALTPQRYADFLKLSFDDWYNKLLSGQPVSDRTFENWIQLLAGGCPESCGVSGICSHQFVLEADASVYPCDFYVLEEWKLGNLATDSFEQLEQKRQELGFVQASRAVHATCRACRWYPLCRGGCRRYREPFVQGQPSLNRFCAAYKQFFPYAIARMERLADAAKKAGAPGTKPETPV